MTRARRLEGESRRDWYKACRKEAPTEERHETHAVIIHIARLGLVERHLLIALIQSTTR